MQYAKAVRKDKKRWPITTTLQPVWIALRLCNRTYAVKHHSHENGNQQTLDTDFTIENNPLCERSHVPLLCIVTSYLIHPFGCQG